MIDFFLKIVNAQSTSVMIVSQTVYLVGKLARNRVVAFIQLYYSNKQDQTTKTRPKRKINIKQVNQNQTKKSAYLFDR